MELVILFAVVAVVVLVASWVMSAKQRLLRALRAAERATVATARDGTLARFDGRVVPGPTVLAPLSGRPCVFFQASVEEWVSNGKNGSWRLRAREVHGVPFAMDDGTGTVLIDPTRAVVDVDLDRTSKSGTFDDPDGVERAFLTRHGLAAAGWVFNKSYRYTEGVIEIGEPVAVMGYVTREPDPDGASRMTGYRDGPPTRVRLGGGADHPIRLSDDRTLTAQPRR